MVIFERRLKNIFMRGWSTECLPCGGKSRNPFAMILVPLERGGLRRHFELLSIEIHRRSSEKSSLEVGQVVIFWTLGSLKNVHKRCKGARIKFFDLHGYAHSSGRGFSKIVEH